MVKSLKFKLEKSISSTQLFLRDRTIYATLGTRANEIIKRKKKERKSFLVSIVGSLMKRFRCHGNPSELVNHKESDVTAKFLTNGLLRGGTLAHCTDFGLVLCSVLILLGARAYEKEVLIRKRKRGVYTYLGLNLFLDWSSFRRHFSFSPCTLFYHAK